MFNEEKINIIEVLNEKQQLENNWNELKNGLRSLYDFDEDVVSKDYLECVEDTLNKMQEIESRK